VDVDQPDNAAAKGDPSRRHRRSARPGDDNVDADVGNGFLLGQPAGKTAVTTKLMPETYTV